jgi:hypothetical protein
MPRLADRRPLPFREKDVARAVRAVRAGGEQIDRVEINPKTGIITVVSAVKTAEPEPGGRAA